MDFTKLLKHLFSFLKHRILINYLMQFFIYPCLYSTWSCIHPLEEVAHTNTRMHAHTSTDVKPAISIFPEEEGRGSNFQAALILGHTLSWVKPHWQQEFWMYWGPLLGLQTQHSSSSIAEDRRFRNKTYKHHWGLNHSKMQWTMLWGTFIHRSHDHIASILTLTKKIIGYSNVVVWCGKCRVCLLCVSLWSSEGSPTYT